MVPLSSHVLSCPPASLPFSAHSPWPSPLNWVLITRCCRFLPFGNMCAAPASTWLSYGASPHHQVFTQHVSAVCSPSRCPPHDTCPSADGQILPSCVAMMRNVRRREVVNWVQDLSLNLEVNVGLSWPPWKAWLGLAGLWVGWKEGHAFPSRVTAKARWLGMPMWGA